MEDWEWINIRKFGYNPDKMTSFEINDLKKKLAVDMRVAHLDSFFGDCADEII